MNPKFAILEEEAEEAITRQALRCDLDRLLESVNRTFTAASTTPEPSFPESSFWTRDWSQLS